MKHCDYEQLRSLKKDGKANGEYRSCLKLYDHTEVLEKMVQTIKDLSKNPIEIDESLPLYAQLKQAREQSGLTGADAANLFGISPSTYQHMEARNIVHYRIPSYDLRRLPVNSKNIIMCIDEMANGDLMIHPLGQGIPVHVLHASDRQFLFQKLIDIGAYYKKIDPEIRMYYNFHDYVVKRNQSKVPLVGPADDLSLDWVNLARADNQELVMAETKKARKEIKKEERRDEYHKRKNLNRGKEEVEQ